MSNVTQTFSIIRSFNSPQEAVTLWGWTASRQDKLFIQDVTILGHTFSGFVECMPYDNHFIYEVPDKLEHAGVPAYMCTCGSPAGLLGNDSYSEDMSVDGLKLACLFRNGMFNEEKGIPHGRHADGSS